MAPSLSLHYDSGGGEGLMGVGWSVGATSQVRRCREIWAQDRETERVDFDGSSFCLDGKPLIVLSTNGVNVEYRTVGDRFAKIISDGGSIANKPTRFVVYEANGRILEYGVTADSRPEVATTGTIALPAERLASISLHGVASGLDASRRSDRGCLSVSRSSRV